MRIQLWGVVSLLVLVVGCSKPKGDCWGQTCSADERCDDMERDCLPDLPPVLTLVAPTGVVSSATFVVTGTATDDGAVTSAEWQSGSSDWTTIPLNPDGKFSITVPAPLVDAKNVVVSARIGDALVKVSADVQVVVDRVGPAIELVSPSEAPVVATASFALVVRATDGSGSLGSLTIDGAAVSSPVSGTPQTRMIVVPADANHLTRTVDVTAADARGNASTQTFSFVEDRVAPIIAFVSPTSTQTITTPSLDVEVTVSEPGMLQAVAFTVSGVVYPASRNGAGHWVATVPVAAGFEGDLTVIATATDDANNSSTQMVTTHVDRAAPTVTISAPTANSIHRTGVPVTVQTVGQTSSVSATLDGQTVMLSGSGATWTGTVPVQMHDFAVEALQVVARDSAGNQGAAMLSIATDTVAPVVTFTSPTPNQKFNAAALSANPVISISWTLQDGDSQATVTTVDGAASSALSTTYTSLASENGVLHSTSVAAADRAGNTTTVMTTFGVDRVAPTITSWTPADRTRNLEPRESTISFSEFVSGAAVTDSALQDSFVTTAQGAWVAGHNQYTITLNHPNRVVGVSVSFDLADAYGNPLVRPPSRNFHIATGLADNTLIASSVSSFDVVSNADGAPVIATIDTSNQLHIFVDIAGNLMELGLPPTTGTRVTLSRVDVLGANQLDREPRFAVNVQQGAAYKYLVWDMATLTTLAPTAKGVVVSRPPFSNEPTTTSTGTVIGTQYTRGTQSVTLTSTANMTIAQSADSFVVANLDSGGVRWNRYRCNANAPFIGGYNCSGTEYLAPMTVNTAALAGLVMSPGGGCVDIQYELTGMPAGSSNHFLVPFENCDFRNGPMLASCVGNLNVTPTPSNLGAAHLAPFNVGGVDSFLIGYRGTTSQWWLTTFSAATCSYAALNRATTMFTLPVTNIVAHRVAQVGNHMGLFYLTSTGELRVHVE